MLDGRASGPAGSTPVSRSGSAIQVPSTDRHARTLSRRGHPAGSRRIVSMASATLRGPQPSWTARQACPGHRDPAEGVGPLRRFHQPPEPARALVTRGRPGALARPPPHISATDGWRDGLATQTVISPTWCRRPTTYYARESLERSSAHRGRKIGRGETNKYSGDCTEDVTYVN